MSAASTTTWKKSAKIPIITRSSKCWGTGPSVTTSRPRPSAGPGNCSPTSGNSTRTNYGPPSSAATAPTTSRRISMPNNSGSKIPTCPKSGFSVSVVKITSGKWGKSDPADRAVKSTWTLDPTAATKKTGPNISAKSTATADALSNSGTWSLFNITEARTAPSKNYPPNTSIPAPAWNASSPFCKTRPATTTPTCSPLC